MGGLDESGFNAKGSPAGSQLSTTRIPFGKQAADLSMTHANLRSESACWGWPTHRPAQISRTCGSWGLSASFCDYQQNNGGTRTWGKPEGDGTRDHEVQGNADAAFAAQLCQVLAENGRLFAPESSAPIPSCGTCPVSGSCGRRLVPKSYPRLCAPGAGLPEAPSGHYHQKRHGGLSHPSSGYGPCFSRTCPGLSAAHQHPPLKGGSPLPAVTLTRLAQ